ncbi:MAG TPA: PTS fructose transporter subunit IIA [Thermoanaerobaculia bacterium]|nr:PTS fructose transporter subunit IIA [Thermoanaerobaculia bacterium]HXM77992.1 PTS fructose transporter subunit IIA [Thermoanaerobaculia bacterium]
MIGVLLVTHGKLAEELRDAALTIQPEMARVVAVALEWNQTGEDARERIARGLAEADEGEGAVILTDMFGGTPTNLTLSFLQKDRVEIVTGVNLPMVLKCVALQRSGKAVVEIAHVAKDRGQRSICVASDLLADEDAESAAGVEREGR